MKVKEIAEVVKVDPSDIIAKLSNIDIVADEETVVDQVIIKKLSKVYKQPIKPIKKIVEKQEEVKVEQPVKEEKEQVKVKDSLPTKKEESKPLPKQKEAQIEKAKPNKQEEVKVEQKEEKVVIPVEELDLTRVYDGKYDEFVEDSSFAKRKNSKRSKNKTTQGRKGNIPTGEIEEKVVYYVEGMTAAMMSDAMKISVGEIVKKLVLLGYMVNASQPIERDIIDLVVDEFGFILKDKPITDASHFEQIHIVDDVEDLVERPAIVTIMGHVDHGKTTLLDTIRNAKVALGEAGGITQHIGAYQVKKSGKLITFIDTPGHAAFTEMRARGAEATDIVILVVAADDGVMPQTREAIEHAKAAKVPIIVAVNKMDKPGVEPDRIKQELANLGLQTEEWGGDTIFVPISALKGTGVDDLLEMILLTSELNDFKANPNRLGTGSVIEAKLDKGRGPIATLLVKNGSLHIGDPIVVGNTHGKIRAMFDEYGKPVKTAGPSKPVEVIGLSEVPQAGDAFMVFDDEKTARLLAEERKQRADYKEQHSSKALSLADLFAQAGDVTKELNVIVKGDVQGSIEALKGQLEKLDVTGVKVNIVRAGVGTITETDVVLAQASASIIIGFNVRPTAAVSDIAKEKGIEIRLYNIIYRILEDIENAMKGMLDPVFEEKVTGQAEVRDTFKVSKVGTIAGCYVTSGMIQRNSKVRLIRDGVVIYDGELSSLKRFKDDAKEVKTGFECGMTIENYNDIKVQDIIEAYVMQKVK